MLISVPDTLKLTTVSPVVTIGDESHEAMVEVDDGRLCFLTPGGPLTSINLVKLSALHNSHQLAASGENLSLMHCGMLRYFDPTHLPAHLARVSAPFSELATAIMLYGTTPMGTYQVDRALQHLLEAKDCMVRSAL